MNAFQRVLVLFALLVFAWLFAVTFCDWGEVSDDRYTLACLWDYNEGEKCFGVARATSMTQAVVLGIMVPIAFTLCAVYLYLGWFLPIARPSRGKPQGEPS